MGERRLLSIATQDQLRQMLKYMLDEREFLSPYGIRALSQVHRDHPYHLSVNGTDHRVDYEPAESSTGLFGGNSNWRGPIWFPVNFLLIESLQKFHYYLGDDFQGRMPHRFRQDDDALGGRRGNFAAADAHLLAAMRIREDRFSAARKNSRTTRTGAI